MRPLPPNDMTRALESARWMQTMARQLAGGASGSDDLVQETWLAYMKQPPRNPGAAGPWLRKVLTSFAFRARRSEARRRAREETVSRPEECPSDPRDLVERAELLQRVSGLALGLAEPYRSTVLLRYFEDLSPAEIAARQSVPVHTVYTRLRRAHEELREQLDREHGGSRGTWLAILAPLGAAPFVAASTAAAASTRVPHTTLGSLAIGGIPLATKKVGIAITVSTLLFLAAGGLLVWLPTRAPERSDASVVRPVSPPPASGALATDASRPGSAATEAAPPSTAAVTVGRPLIRGRVVDPSGSGLEGVTVTRVSLAAWSERTGPDLEQLKSIRDGDISTELAAAVRRFEKLLPELPHTVTRADGEFSFDEVEDGEHRLLAWRDGSLSSAETIVLVPSPEAAGCVIELAPALAIRGRVIDEEQRPIAGAEVRAAAASWRTRGDRERLDEIVSLIGEAKILTLTAATASGAGGVFVLGSLEPGLHDLRAHASGASGGTLLGVVAGSTGLELVVELGGKVTGTVVDASTRPVRGAEVTLEPRPESFRAAPAVGEALETAVAPDILLAPPAFPRAVTGGDGRFAIAGVAPGGYALVVRTALALPFVQEIDVRGATDVGQLAIGDGRAIAGVVRDPAGQPVQDARVWIEDVPPGGITEWGGRFRAPPALVETRTDPRGAFRLEGLRPGSYSVRAASAAWAERAVTGVQPGAEDLVLELAAGLTARGSVVDGMTGEPIAGAIVELELGIQRLPAAEKIVESGPGGRFELKGLPEATDKLTLAARHPSYPNAEGADCEIDVRRSGNDAVLKLFPSEPLRGRVVDAGGSEVAGALVTCTLRGAGRCSSGQDGRFALQIPRSARQYTAFEIAASHPIRGCNRVVVEPPAGNGPWPDAEIVLGPSRVLTGKVLDTAGAAIPRAAVSIRRLPAGDLGGRGDPHLAYSGADGAFRFARLEPSAYELDARAIGFAPGPALLVEASESGREQVIVLERGRAITGRVVDAAGRAVAGASVIALGTVALDESTDFHTGPERWRRRHSETAMASSATGAAGSFEVRDLPAGPVTLVARARGHEPSELIVLGPEETSVELVVTPLGGIVGRVEDGPTGSPHPLFTVWFGRKDSKGATEKTYLPRDYDNPLGEFRLDSLPPGAYAVAVITAGRPAAFESVSVLPGEVALVRVRLQPGVSVTGVVTEAGSGAPIAGARVIAHRAAGWEIQMSLPSRSIAWSQADGTFRVDGLDAGKHELYVNAAGYKPKWKGFRIEAGVEPPRVEVQMKAAGAVVGKIANLAKRKASVWSFLAFQRVDEPGKEAERHPIHERKDEFLVEGIAPGRYFVELREQVRGPNIPPGASQWKTEDMIERAMPLGEVEVRPGETARFDATVPPEE